LAPTETSPLRPTVLPREGLPSTACEWTWLCVPNRSVKIQRPGGQTPHFVVPTHFGLPQITAADIIDHGWYGYYLWTVTNPAPGGGTSCNLIVSPINAVFQGPSAYPRSHRPRAYVKRAPAFTLTLTAPVFRHTGHQSLFWAPLRFTPFHRVHRSHARSFANRFRLPPHHHGSGT